MLEEWRTIEGFERYQVSNLGNVRSFSCGRKGKLLKPCMSRGVMKVTFSTNGKLKTFDIHRLVAESFLEKLEVPCIAKHKDGNKNNNVVENIEWIPRKNDNPKKDRIKVDLLEGFTVEEYWELYEKLGTSRKIADAKFVSYTYLYKWEKENDIDVISRVREDRDKEIKSKVAISNLLKSRGATAEEIAKELGLKNKQSYWHWAYKNKKRGYVIL